MTLKNFPVITPVLAPAERRNQMKKLTNTKINDDRRSHLRPAKNFLGILGRATRRLGIRKEEGLVARAMNRLYPPDPHTLIKPKRIKNNTV